MSRCSMAWTTADLYSAVSRLYMISMELFQMQNSILYNCLGRTQADPDVNSTMQARIVSALLYASYTINVNGFPLLNPKPQLF
jgi:hypothetical protein